MFHALITFYLYNFYMYLHNMGGSRWGCRGPSSPIDFPKYWFKQWYNLWDNPWSGAASPYPTQETFLDPQIYSLCYTYRKRSIYVTCNTFRNLIYNISNKAYIENILQAKTKTKMSKWDSNHYPVS